LQKTNGFLTNSPKVFAEAQVTINDILNGHNMSQNCFNKKKHIFFQIPTVSAQAREEGFVPEPSKENLLESSQVAIEIR